jgi:hypothetical protein
MNEQDEAAYLKWRRGIFGEEMPDSDNTYRACFMAGKSHGEDVDDANSVINGRFEAPARSGGQ